MSENPQHPVELTYEEFNNLSYYHLAWFWVTYTIAIHRDAEGNLTIYGNSENSKSPHWLFWNHRANGLNKRQYSSAEMMFMEVPAGHSIAVYAEKYFSKMFFKGDLPS